MNKHFNYLTDTVKFIKFVVWQHWTCLWTLEFVDFPLYAILLK